MTVRRVDNVGIVIEDIDVAIEFFTPRTGVARDHRRGLGRRRHGAARHARRGQFCLRRRGHYPGNTKPLNQAKAEMGEWVRPSKKSSRPGRRLAIPKGINRDAA